MRILRGILFTLLGLLLLLVIVSFFLPSKVNVTRSATINAPADRIFTEVNDFKNWPKWMPWSEKDPTMKFTYDATTAGKGAGYCWKSEAQGNGCMKIAESVANSSIQTEIDFGDRGTSLGSWKFEPEGSQTKVTWGMEADMSKPPIIGKYFGLMMDGMVGGDFERGLANIKKITE